MSRPTLVSKDTKMTPWNIELKPDGEVWLFWNGEGPQKALRLGQFDDVSETLAEFLHANGFSGTGGIGG